MESLFWTAAGQSRDTSSVGVSTALDAEAATIVTYDPHLRDAAAPQGLFVAPEVLG